jgi:hypothetical protein
MGNINSFNRFEDNKFRVTGAILWMTPDKWSVVIIHKDENDRVEVFDNFQSFEEAKEKMDKCFYNKRNGISNDYIPKNINITIKKKKK